jgi:tetratricopeptide (TPR) repeat protein
MRSLTALGRRRLLAACVVVAAVGAAYLNTLGNGFVGDDHIYIEANPFVSEPRSLRVLADPRYYLGAHEVLAGSRPIFLASLVADRAFWGARPAGFHLTNAALHAAVSVEVLAVAAAVGLPLSAAVTAGLVFGLHPVATEAVDCISFRTDPLAALFVLAGLLGYLECRRRDLPLWGAAAAAAALLPGLLSKETALALPVLVALAEWYLPPAPGLGRRLGAALGAQAAVGAAFLGFWAPRFRYHGMGAPGPLRGALDRLAALMPTAPGPGAFALSITKGRIYPPASWEFAPLFARPGAAAAAMFKALSVYARLFVWPHPLVVDRAPVPASGWTDPAVLAGLAFALMLAAAALLLRRRSAAAAFGAAWVLVALAPASNLIPLYNPVAERYLYLPSVGVALAAGALFAWARSRPGASADRSSSAATAGAAALCAVFACLTIARNADWTSEASLYFPAPAAPQEARASLVRGALRQAEGRYEEAASEYLTALRLNPGMGEAAISLGQTYAALGRREIADQAYERGLAASPGNPMFRFSYGLYLARTGRLERAAQAYREAVRLEPGFVEAWVNLGALQRNRGRWREAAASYQKALAAARPGDPVPRFSYGTMLERKGDWRGAAEQYLAACREDPAFRPARLRLARIYAVHGRRAEMQRQLDEAAAVVEVTSPAQP